MFSTHQGKEVVVFSGILVGYDFVIVNVFLNVKMFLLYAIQLRQADTYRDTCSCLLPSGYACFQNLEPAAC
jgi:hypothetical protein